MDEQFISSARTKMFKAFEVTKNDLLSVHTGRAAPSLVDNLEVAVYGGSTKLKIKELATVTSSDVQTLLIHPFDPSTRDEIVKGILEANTGFTPVAEAEVIRISIPSLSKERREEYIKLAKAKLEAGRIMVRQVRHEEMSGLKKLLESKEITEDDKKRLEKHVQELTDEMIVEIDHLGEIKEKELMQI
jgi:ribosome recycling factor